MNLYFIAGPICRGIDCAPLYLVVIWQRYGFYILGAILIVLGLIKLSKKNKNKNKRRKTFILLAAGIISLSINPALNLKAAREFQKEEQGKVRFLTFETYGYDLPSGWRLEFRYISNLYKTQAYSDNFPKISAENDDHSHIVEKYTTKHSLFYIRQFDDKKYSGSSKECWPSDPEFPEPQTIYDECEQIGSNNEGGGIYAIPAKESGKFLNVFTTVNGTRVNINADLFSPIDKTDALKIMQSLRVIDKNKLKFINSE